MKIQYQNSFRSIRGLQLNNFLCSLWLIFHFKADVKKPHELRITSYHTLSFKVIKVSFPGMNGAQQRHSSLSLSLSHITFNPWINVQYNWSEGKGVSTVELKNRKELLFILRFWRIKHLLWREHFMLGHEARRLIQTDFTPHHHLFHHQTDPGKITSSLDLIFTQVNSVSKKKRQYLDDNNIKRKNRE